MLRGLIRHGVAASVEHYHLRSRGYNTIIDVGANRGQFSLFARHYYSHAMIYAFEPLDNPFSKLSALFASDPRVRVVKSAVGDVDGETIN